MAEVVLSPIDDRGIATITFASGRPLNTMSRETVDKLRAAVDEAAGVTGLRVLVLRGAGGVFSGGADLTMMRTISPDDYAAYIDAEFALFDAVEALPFVTIAALEGPCMGNGGELALSCDLRIARIDARFGLPETRIGFQGPMGRLIRYVGLGVAQRLLFCGDVLSAQDAVDLGLISWAVVPEWFEEELERRAADVAALPPIALLETKRNLAAAFPLKAEWTANEKRSSVRTFGTEDAAEGREAFLEKRNPVFRGR
jgi:enoyl-CoA hydratase/carnithine racemase